MAIIDELVAILRFDTQGGQEVDRFNRKLRDSERQANNMAVSFGKIAARIGTLVAAWQVGDKIGQFVGDITRVNSEFESYEATLKTITGSAEEARAAMDWISDFGAKTPYDVAEVTKAFVQLKAYGIDPMDGTLLRVGDAASAMNKGLMQGVEAIADAMTGENERLKEFGIRTEVAGDRVTYKWTQNGKELSKTVQKNATEIQGALLGIFSRFEGAMDEQSSTWRGMTSNLSDTWIKFLREIGEAGYYVDIKRRLQGVLDFANEAFGDGSAQGLARRISDALVGAMDAIEHVAVQSYRIGRGFYYAADGIADFVSKATGMPKLLAGGAVAATAIGSTVMGRAAMMAVARRIPQVAAILAIDDILSGLSGDESWIGSLEGGEEVLQRIRDAFKEIRDAADGLAGAINSAFGVQASEAQSQIQALSDAVRELYGDWVVSYFNRLAMGLEFFAGVIGTIRDLIANARAEIEEWVGWFQGIFDRIASLNPFSEDRPMVLPPVIAPAGPAQTGISETQRRQQQAFVPSDVAIRRYREMYEFMLDTSMFDRQYSDVNGALGDLDRTVTPKVDVDTSAALRKIEEVERRMRGLDGASARIGASAGSRAAAPRPTVEAAGEFGSGQ